MPRDGNGVYTQAPNTDAVSGETISSTAFNAFAADLVSDANFVKPVAQGGTGAQNAADARANLGAGTGDGDMLAANNLSDVASAATSRSNLGVFGATDDATFGTLTVSGASTLTGAVSTTGDITVSKATPKLTLSNNTNPTIELDRPSGRSYAIQNNSGNLRVLSGSPGAANASITQLLVTSALMRFSDGTGTELFEVSDTEFTYKTDTIWTSGNDGAGSGMDADTVDGVQASAFAQLTGATFSGDVRTSGVIEGQIPAEGVTTGTLTEANANCQRVLTGGITIPNGVFSGGDIVGPLLAGSAARTITRGSGLTMYVNGTNVASATISARGVCSIVFQVSNTCYVTGDVS